MRPIDQNALIIKTKWPVSNNVTAPATVHLE